MRSQLDGVNRARDIEVQNKRLGGFLDIFSGLSPVGQADAMELIEKLKKESKSDEEFLIGIKALTQFFILLTTGAEGKPVKDAAQILRARLQDAEIAAREAIAKHAN